MTRNDVLAARSEIADTDNAGDQARILARYLKLDYQSERDLADILSGGEIRTYEQGRSDGYEDGKDAGRSEIPLLDIREELTTARSKLEALRSAIQTALDDTLDEATRSVNSAETLVKEV